MYTYIRAVRGYMFNVYNGYSVVSNIMSSWRTAPII